MEIAFDQKWRSRSIRSGDRVRSEVEIAFDQNKSDENEVRRGLPFSLVADFDWTTAVVVADERYDYPEPRFLGLGPIARRLHVVVFTPTVEGIRVISFRKANRREGRKYDQARS